MNRFTILVNETQKKILKYMGLQEPTLEISTEVYLPIFARSGQTLKFLRREKRNLLPVNFLANLSDTAQAHYYIYKLVKIIQRRFFEGIAKICKNSKDFFWKIKNLGIDLENAYFKLYRKKAYKRYFLKIENEKIICVTHFQENSGQKLNGSKPSKRDSICVQKVENPQVARTKLNNQLMLGF